MTKRQKTAKETAKPVLVRRPNSRGALLSSGVPGNRGGGCPPDEFRAKMCELVNATETIEYLTKCLKGEHGPMVFVKALQFAAERGYGKADQVVAVKDDRVIRYPIPANDTEEWLERTKATPRRRLLRPDSSSSRTSTRS